MGKPRAEMRTSERTPAALLLLRDVTILQRRIGCERSVSLFHISSFDLMSVISALMPTIISNGFS